VQENISARTTTTASLLVRDNAGTASDSGFFLIVLDRP